MCADLESKSYFPKIDLTAVDQKDHFKLVPKAHKGIESDSFYLSFEPEQKKHSKKLVNMQTSLQNVNLAQKTSLNSRLKRLGANLSTLSVKNFSSMESSFCPNSSSFS